MKHVDQTTRKNVIKVENLLLIGILAFSMWGGFHLLDGSGRPAEPAAGEVLALPPESGEAASAQFAGLPGEHLYVSGEAEAGAPLLFEIRSFNRNARYEIWFGDGRREVVTSRNMAHTYREPGRYTLRLTVEYNGHVKILDDRNLRIGEAGNLAQRN